MRHSAPRKRMAATAAGGSLDSSSPKNCACFVVRAFCLSRQSTAAGAWGLNLTHIYQRSTCGWTSGSLPDSAWRCSLVWIQGASSLPRIGRCCAPGEGAGLLSRVSCACVGARSGGLGGGEDGEVTLAVTGMSCASCSSKIQATLQALPFVAHAVVNLLAEKAVVSFRPESMVGVDEGVAKAVAAVTKLGFGAERLTAVQAGRVSLFVDGMVCASCPPRIECALGQLDGVQRYVPVL
jgi:copper chaperone CopZ